MRPQDTSLPNATLQSIRGTFPYLLVGCGLGLTAAWIAFLGYELVVLIGLGV